MIKKPDFSRPTWAEIDLGALEHNFKLIRRLTGPGTKILVAVKANAYGHGAVPVAKRLEHLGVDYLGVASIDEARQLREARILKPILIFGSLLYYEVDELIRYKLTATVGDLKLARLLNSHAVRLKTKVTVHVKIDTGMGRFGIWHDEAFNFIKELSRFKNLNLEGVYTHFPSADSDKKFTNQQIERLNELIEKLKTSGIKIPLSHAANSMATISYRHAHLNLVRPGLMIYGLYPKEELKKKIRLKPVLSLKSKIVFLKKVPPGRSISYGRTHITASATVIATLPIGYADGYVRAFSNKATVLVKNRRSPVVGRVCMDFTMIDVGRIPQVKITDEVVLIGRQGKEEISAEDLARIAGTISYEIVCWISGRVPRVYLPR
ncbi:MAG: alanine racemase [Candidatus Omnitrophota bacterium]